MAELGYLIAAIVGFLLAQVAARGDYMRGYSAGTVHGIKCVLRSPEVWRRIYPECAPETQRPR